MVEDKERIKRAVSYTALISYMIFIFCMSHMSSPPSVLGSSTTVKHMDIIEHVIEYIILSILFCIALSTEREFDVRKVVIVAPFFCLAYGITDEIHQYFIPWRKTSFIDVLSDFLGGILGALLYMHIMKIISHRIILHEVFFYRRGK